MSSRVSRFGAILRQTNAGKDAKAKQTTGRLEGKVKIMVEKKVVEMGRVLTFLMKNFVEDGD